MQTQTQPVSILNCFTEGLSLIFSKGFRRFIFIPLLLNLLIFIALSSVALDYAQALFSNLETYLPHWLLWLKWLLWPLLVLITLIVYAYCFNLITTIIAAPFLGLLAEKIEAHITRNIPAEETLASLIPRTFKREFTKLIYFVPRSLAIGLIIFMLIFLPGANFLGVLIGGLWGSWCLALQFCDYAADNHQLPFTMVRQQLGQQKISSFMFGGLVLAGSMTPFLNIVITPLAVAAGTIYWTRK
ncbi:sulfate transporter CysZ [Cellvibrio zantedeschiae]|uniref:Sulfate transporter CysZ n=1 Tax=Cellvibrio zantedeschiae TaxID=1237077 RepID=A0ABQ3B1R2_9GAMM|nr:sulfate transporter CysZ [Cellvibrio zantedeschiae]GGY75362.1 sulfate transporter CysZ [Cellvibrio zantedeschiae]